MDKGNTIALVVAIPSLIIAIGGLINGFTSRKEIKGKTEQVWMTLTKESTDMVLDRLEELKKENEELRVENRKCNQEMQELKRWLVSQGIRVPNPPGYPGIG